LISSGESNGCVEAGIESGRARRMNVNSSISFTLFLLELDEAHYLRQGAIYLPVSDHQGQV
jgi:hypothetical protein